MLDQALAGGYAVGYFEAWDEPSLEAVCDAAQAEDSPVILGIGCMMVDPEWLESGGLVRLAATVRRLAERASIPCATLLNEARSERQVNLGIESGFTAVMLDTSAWPVDEAVPAVRDLVARAHSHGISVEAELGRLPDAVPDGIDTAGASLTDPGEAAAYVAATGVDALAVSFGNVHCLEGSSAEVDLDLLARVRRAVGVPLVVHGGTSFPTDQIHGAIRAGAAKFNVGTVLKRAFAAGIQAGLADTTASVHTLMGSHAPGDIMELGKAAMREKVRELMRLYGSTGKGATTALKTEVSR